MTRFLSILVLLVISHSAIYGQSKIDILKFKLDTIQNDTIKASLLRSLARKYSKKNSDSAMFYLMQSLALSQKIEDKDSEARTLRFIGIQQKMKGDTDSALVSFKRSLALHKANNNEKEVAFVYNNIGIVYKNLGRYEEAIQEYIKALKIFDKINNNYGIALVYNNIGIVHKNQKNLDLAIEYYYKALEINKTDSQLNSMASNYNNIGTMLMRLNLKDSALICYKQAKKIREIDNDQLGIADSYSHIGNYYNDIEQWDKALEYYSKAIPILEKNNYGISLLYAYYNYAQTKYELGLGDKKSSVLLHEAEEYALKSLEMAKAANYLVGQSNDYRLLSKIYSQQEKYKKALTFYHKYFLLNDSLFNLDRSQKMATAEARYNSEKKQLEIDKLESQQALDIEKMARQEAENKKQKILKYVFLIGAIFLVVFVLYVLRNLNNKKAANQILNTQKEEIEEQNEELNQFIEEITTQKEELEIQRDRVEQQKEELEEVNLDISNSIEYAKKIQRSILPSSVILKRYISDSFIFFKPRDVVSGDFYWWAKIEDQLVITAADSTGHGVPGAFMSMLGVSFLREIVLKEYITHPGVILRKMRKEIINALRQKQELQKHDFSANKDGMDMALISLNLNTNLLQYAGANNPIYIITKDERPIANYTEVLGLKGFYEIKPDKMPISIYDKMDRFKTHEIQLAKGDQIYLFSDGYADQFGGPRGKKLKYKPFKKLLYDNSKFSSEEQKESLFNTFMDWKGSEEQVDDVVVLGIKI